MCLLYCLQTVDDSATMLAWRFIALFQCLPYIINVETATVKVESQENPIRKTVTLLQQIQGRVLAEMKEAKIMYDKEICACQTLGVRITEELEDLEAKLPVVQNTVNETGSTVEQLEEEIEQGEEVVEEDEEVIHETQNHTQEQEETVYIPEMTQKKIAMNALARAIYAIEHGGVTPEGTGAAFVQTPAFATLKNIAMTANMNPNDREMLTNFLEQAQKYKTLGRLNRSSEDPVEAAEDQMVGGCAGTEHGCCDDLTTPKNDADGSNCEENWECAKTTHKCCPDGENKAKIDAAGSNCKAMQACYNAVCGAYTCPDGKGPRKIGKLCCQCPSGKNKLSANVQEVIGMLKSMQEDMQEDFEGVAQEEEEVTTNAEAIIETKTTEETAVAGTVSDKKEEKAETELEHVEAEGEADTTQATLTQEQQLMAEHTARCYATKAEYAEAKKQRDEEIVTITQVISHLNNDEKLELFKKTLASPTDPFAFVQTGMTSENVRVRALRALRLRSPKYGNKAFPPDPRLMFIEMAMRGHKEDVEKIIKKMEVLAKIMVQEQKDDDAEKKLCEEKMEQNGRDIDLYNRTINDLNKIIAEKVTLMEQTKAEIEKLKEEIPLYDQWTADARKLRAEQNSDYHKNTNDQRTAKETLEYAKNMLNKFYNPTMWVDPAAAPVFTQTKEDPSSMIPGAKKFKATKDYGGQVAIEMLDALINEAKTNMVELKAQEDRQEKAFTDQATEWYNLRIEKGKELQEKKARLANEEEAAGNKKNELQAAEDNLEDTQEELRNWHKRCDFLLKYYEERKTARAQEKEGIENAKNTLLGADGYFFIEMKHRTRRLRGRGGHIAL